jgi:hypothetical protein
MIKSFNHFNESKDVIHFEDSQEFHDVKMKYKLSNDMIKDYFTDLIDERGFEIKDINCGLGSIKNGIQLSYRISFLKILQNPEERNSVKSSNYLEFINEQVKDIKLINECLLRFSEVEELNIKFNNVIQVPFWGAGGNTKKTSEFEIIASLVQEIETNDLNTARESFKKSNNPAKVAYYKVIKILQDSGVTPADRLIDSVDHGEGYIMFGFITDDEIIVIADYHYDSKIGLVIHEDEVDRAISYYEDGYSDGTLGY